MLTVTWALSALQAGRSRVWVLTVNLVLFCGVLAVPAEHVQGLHHLIWSTTHAQQSATFVSHSPAHDPLQQAKRL